MKKYIEGLFLPSLEAIKLLQPKLKEDGTQPPIEREYQSYIASFGASIMQMGLLPTLAVYADKDSGSKADRQKLLAVLGQVIASDKSAFPHKTQIADKKNLFEFAVKLDANGQRALKEHLLDAAVAVKLCLRTFKLTSK